MGLLGKKFAETVCQFNGNPIILDVKPKSSLLILKQTSKSIL